MTENELFAHLLAVAKSARRPPIEKWNPEYEGEIDIRIATDGGWWHQGRLIKRPSMVKVFASILRCDAGCYYLVTPQDKLRIQVDDVPFLIVDFVCNGAGQDRQILMTTNIGEIYLVSSEYPLYLGNYKGQLLPYLSIRSGLQARLNRSTYYSLIDIALDAQEDTQEDTQEDKNDKEKIGVWSCQKFYALAT